MAKENELKTIRERKISTNRNKNVRTKFVFMMASNKMSHTNHTTLYKFTLSELQQQHDGEVGIYKI